MKPKLVLISGLTAVGKTLIASGLCKKLNTEIIVGDSIQVGPLIFFFPKLSSFIKTTLLVVISHLQL